MAARRLRAVLPDASNTTTPLFNVERLRRSLAPLLSDTLSHAGLPFQEFGFVDERETAVRFTVVDKDYILQQDTYTIPVTRRTMPRAGGSYSTENALNDVLYRGRKS